MSFEQLQAKVARAEDTLEAHERRTAADLRVFGGCWRELWSPSRVVGTGLAAGFLIGWAQPGRTVAGVQPARWLHLASSVAGLASSVQAAFAASGAKEAAEDAGHAAAASTAAGVGMAGDPPGMDVAPATAATAPVPGARTRAPDPTWDTQPRPAEAATELSEPR
jgi:hypothetical protein